VLDVVEPAVQQVEPTQHGFADPVVPCRVGDAPRHGIEQAQVDAVVSQLHAGFAARVQPGQRVAERAADAQAVDRALVELLELVAIDRLVQRLGEVGAQVEGWRGTKPATRVRPRASSPCHSATALVRWASPLGSGNVGRRGPWAGKAGRPVECVGRLCRIILSSEPEKLSLPSRR
jgi:hypothetical protein